MRILVTGGTGFLGRHVVWRLCRLGHDVVFTGRSRAQAADVLAHAVAADGAKPVFIALAHGAEGSAQALASAALGADAIVHCAALSSPWGRRRDFMQANVAATQEVIDACQAQGVRTLVHISTPGLYFDFRDRLQIREDEPLPKPANDYAATKAMAEQLVRASGIGQVVILRPRAIFGPWDRTLLPRLIRVATRSRLPLMRDGAALLDLTCVDNVVDAVLLAIDFKPSVPGQAATFNVSNGEPMAVADLFRVMSSAFKLPLNVRRVPYPLVAGLAALLEGVATVVPGWEPPVTRYSAGLLAFSQTLDLTRAREQLGYRPRVALSDGLAQTAAWFNSPEGCAVLGMPAT